MSLMRKPSWTGTRLVHPDYDDHYGLDDGGLSEAAHVFVDSARLVDRFSAMQPGDRFVVGELGMGAARNLLAVWRCFETHAPARATLDIYTLESHPPAWNDALKAIVAMWDRTSTELQTKFEGLVDRLQRLQDTWPTSLPGWSRLDTGTDQVRLQVGVGPAEATLPWAHFTADHWMLDGFSPTVNPELWSAELLAQVARHTRHGGTAVTYSAAGQVRRALQTAGFSVDRVPGHGRKREMLVGTLTTTVPGPTSRLRLPWPVPRQPGRIVVVGAGIAGTSMARRLAEEELEVTLLEAEFPGAGASGNPWGLLQPLPNLGGSPVGDWTTRGFVWTRAWALRMGLPLQPLQVARYGASDRAAYVDRLRTELPWGDVLEAGTDIDNAPPGAILGIRTAAMAPPIRWCQLLADHPSIRMRKGRVVGLEEVDGSWRLTLADGDVLGADTVVLANSTQARDLLPALDLHPVRGQLATLEPTEQSRDQQRALCGSIYLLPARDGTHVLGATYDRDDPDPSVRAADTAHLLGELGRMLPGALGDPPVVTGARVSWRGVTPGRLPFVGPVDTPTGVADSLEPRKATRPSFSPTALRPGLWVSVGHGSRGLCGGPLAAHLLAEAILGRRPPLPDATLDAVHPSRVTVARLRRR